MVEAAFGQMISIVHSANWFLSLLFLHFESIYSFCRNVLGIFADCSLKLNPLGAISERDKPVGFHFNKFYKF